MVKDDTWAQQPYGAPFPARPVRVEGDQNQYVALWYRHGKPVCGRAWNNGGNVECSFPTERSEMAGKNTLTSEIQILTYPYDDRAEGHSKLGFWYKWVQYKDRFEQNTELVRCGNSTPVLMTTKLAPGKLLCGQLNLTTEKAGVGIGDKVEWVQGAAVQTMQVLVRDLKAPPPPSGFTEDQWVDVNCNDPMPAQAYGTPGIKQEDGSTMQHYVALWYKHGEPVMGRVWSKAGKVQAAFGWQGHEFIGNVGSIQMLTYPQGKCLFFYEWRPLREAMAGYRTKGEWQPVHIGDAAPCIIKSSAGHERLGSASLTSERCGAAFNGKEEVYEGGKVQDFRVLCRHRL